MDKTIMVCPKCFSKKIKTDMFYSRNLYICDICKHQFIKPRYIKFSKLHELIEKGILFDQLLIKI